MEVSGALDLVALAESVEENMLGEQAASWAERLDRRAAHLRPAAAALLAAGNLDGALRLVGALSRYAQASGRVDQVRDLADYVLASVAGREPSNSALAAAMLVKGELAFRQGDQGVAAAATETALGTAEDGGDARMAARAEMNLARIAFRDGDAARIFEHAERMLEFAGDDGRLRAGAVHMLAWAEYTAGDVSAAIARFEENVELYRDAGNLIGMAGELANLGDLAAEAGDFDRAATFLRESLDLAVSTHSRYLLPSLLASAATLAGARGRQAETLELAAAADEQYSLAGLTPDPGDEVSTRIHANALAKLGAEKAEELAERGRERTLDDAVELARSVLR